MQLAAFLAALLRRAPHHLGHASTKWQHSQRAFRAKQFPGRAVIAAGCLEAHLHRQAALAVAKTAKANAQGLPAAGVRAFGDHLQIHGVWAWAAASADVHLHRVVLAAGLQQLLLQRLVISNPAHGFGS